MKSQSLKKKKVFVGLSGGVDSSVSAALLQKDGYDVTGVFIKTWTPDFLECTWREDRLDAMRVCAHLGINFIDLDLSKEYKREVVDYMIAEYKAGRTPNPDVMCNKYIKFGGFFDWAIRRGADFVATGHYARVKKISAGRFQLLTGKDKNKDQSYFLWTITQKQLSKTLFPVGGLEKPEVRKLAKKFGLPTADKKDSQGLCFMGKVDIKDFLSHYIKSKHGKVLLAPSKVEENEMGEEIGWHDGAMFLTIGERHGFTISKKTPNDTPYFIIARDIKKNTITVAHKSLKGELPRAVRGIVVKDINLISPISSDGLTARVRYRQPLQRVRIKNDKSGMTNKKMTVEFENPQIAAAGQSVVLYDGEECLGGGVIS